MSNGRIAGSRDTEEEWALLMAKIHMELGPGCADVVRRFVAGEIEYLEPSRWDDGRQTT